MKVCSHNLIHKKVKKLKGVNCVASLFMEKKDWLNLGKILQSVKNIFAFNKVVRFLCLFLKILRWFQVIFLYLLTYKFRPTFRNCA